MSLKKIEQIKKIYERITELDSQIISIEKAALRLSDNEDEVKISITGKYQKGTEPVDVSKLDQEMIMPGLGSIMFGFCSGGYGGSGKSDTKSFSIDQSLSATEALVIMDALVRFKNEQRKALSKQLQELVPA